MAKYITGQLKEILGEIGVNPGHAKHTVRYHSHFACLEEVILTVWLFVKYK